MLILCTLFKNMIASFTIYASSGASEGVNIWATTSSSCISAQKYTEGCLNGDVTPKDAENMKNCL